MVMLSRLFLILSLIAGSVLMAPARWTMAGTSRVEVCSGLGTQTLIVDGRGNPVGTHSPCPDCTLCQAMGPLPQVGSLHRLRVAGSLAYPLLRGTAAQGALAIRAAARDPPVSA